MLSKIFHGLLEIAYPRVCVACKAKLKERALDNLVCSKCFCAIKLNADPLSRLCSDASMHFDRAYAPCIFSDVLKDLIHEFKYNGKDHLAVFFSRLMIDSMRTHAIPLTDIDLIIPIPLHKKRLREREFNQAGIIAEKIARELHKPMDEKLLLRSRPTRNQAELNLHDRFSNIEGSFTVKKDSSVKGKNILLIDDVLTTGATCSEAARTLKRAGALTVTVMTIAS